MASAGSVTDVASSEREEAAVRRARRTMIAIKAMRSVIKMRLRRTLIRALCEDIFAIGCMFFFATCVVLGSQCGFVLRMVWTLLCCLTQLVSPNFTGQMQGPVDQMPSNAADEKAWPDRGSPFEFGARQQANFIFITAINMYAPHNARLQQKAGMSYIPMGVRVSDCLSPRVHRYAHHCAEQDCGCCLP